MYATEEVGGPRDRAAGGSTATAGTGVLINQNRNGDRGLAAPARRDRFEAGKVIISMYATIIACSGALFFLTVVASQIAASRLVARLRLLDPDCEGKISHPLIVWGETKEQSAFEHFVVSRDSDKYQDSTISRMSAAHSVVKRTDCKRAGLLRDRTCVATCSD